LMPLQTRGIQNQHFDPPICWDLTPFEPIVAGLIMVFVNCPFFVLCLAGIFLSHY
jgi:hypothetical protein